MFYCVPHRDHATVYLLHRRRRHDNCGGCPQRIRDRDREEGSRVARGGAIHRTDKTLIMQWNLLSRIPRNEDTSKKTGHI